MTLRGVVDRLLGQPSPEEVVRKYGPQVYRHLQRIFGPNGDIDDVYQVVFMEVLRSLPSFEGRAKLSTWIRRITWNVAYQEMRSHYRHQHLTPLEEATQPTGELATDELAERNQAIGRLYAALERLDARHRAPLIMHDVEGKTLKEISIELGRPLPTIASQIYAARTKLARAMKRRSLRDAPASPGPDVEELR